MLACDIEIVGQDLSTVEVEDIIDRLKENNVRILSLRGCQISDSDFQRLVFAVGLCKSILQLNCALGMVDGLLRVELLSQALMANSSLRDIFLHSNPLGDDGTKLICAALFDHPKVISLDVGDCDVEDIGLEAVCSLLPSNGPKLGLQDLVLSANPKITSLGWAKFAVALSACASLKSLYIDYNNLGDYGIGCIAMSLVSNKHMEYLDLESTQMTQHSADLLLYLLKTYPVHLQKIVLLGNDIHPSTLEAIRMCLTDLHEHDVDIAQLKLNGSTSFKKTKNGSMRKLTKKSGSIKGTGQSLTHGTLMNCYDISTDKQDTGQSITSTGDRSQVTVVKDKKSKSRLRSTDTGSEENGNDSLDSSVEDYEEMTEIPKEEIQQPRTQTWISLNKHT